MAIFWFVSVDQVIEHHKVVALIAPNKGMVELY